MKPVAFDYVRPANVAEAAAALTAADGSGKLVAGGQSLGPMLNLRLVQPTVLVDIAGLAELTRCEETADTLTLGAATTAAAIEDRRVPVPAIMAEVARTIAYRAVRNRGTLGGSLVHSDPAADWVNLMPALGASMILTGAAGTREVPAAAFMQSAFEADVAADEVLTGVRIPKLSDAARWGVEKISRKTGKFAMAIGISLTDPEREVCRLVMGATHGRPIVIEGAADLTRDGARNTERLAALLDAAGVVDPAQRQLHIVALRRAIAAASVPA